MKLYMKEKVFSFNDRFTVKDENGWDKYFVEGEFFSWGKKLHLLNIHGEEVAFVQQKLFTWMPRFTVSVQGRQIAEIRKEFTFFIERYVIDGLGWEIEGSVWDHEYAIYQNGRRIVSIDKEWFTWGDSYVLDIADPKDEIVALAVVLTIDCVREASDNQNNHNQR